VLWKCDLEPNTKGGTYATRIWKLYIKKNVQSNARERTPAPELNNEFYNLYKDLNVTDDIKIRRLRWAGHIIRAEERIHVAHAKHV